MTIPAILLIIALILFAVDATIAPHPRLQSAGLAFIAAAMLVPMV